MRRDARSSLVKSSTTTGPVTVACVIVTDDFIMLAPIYLDFDGQIARLGAAKMFGNSTISVNVALPKRPKRVLLNYMHDVLEQ